MKLYYSKDKYVADDSVAIRSWIKDEEFGYFAPYGDVTVCLKGYGVTPEEGFIFIPTYKMTDEYFNQVCEDIVDEVITTVQIGYGRGVYAKLKDNWEEGVEMYG